MPQAVSYWTGIWEPQREAISSQVALLRTELAPAAPVVSMSVGQLFAWEPRDNVIRLSDRQWPMLRALAAARERRFRLSHIVFDLSAWHLLRALGRRPILFTVVGPGQVPEPALTARVAAFVAETDVLARALRASGVAPDRIRVISPGVDLDRFAPAGEFAQRFRVLFASSPTSAAEIERRGIPLLIEAARLCPEIDFTLLWREWGDRAAFDRALLGLRPPPNVVNVRADLRDMAQVYRRADAVALLTAEGYGKSCPNSIVEGLASGCAAVVSRSSGLADLLERTGAGIAVAREPRAVAQALMTLAAERKRRSALARAVAVQCFDVNQFISAYRRLYEELGAVARIRVTGRDIAVAGDPA